jgi:hypothetical protein
MHALALALTPALAALGAATSPGGEWRHFASLAVVPRDHNRGGPPRRAPGEPGWMAACYHLTTWVERVSARAALLDLGVCTGSEALAVMYNLAVTGHRARAGVGPSSALAHLAVLTARPAPSCGRGLRRVPSRRTR